MAEVAAASRYPWLIVGLGNPGPAYAGNRHNVGFMVVDVLASRAGGRFKGHRSNAEVVEGRLNGTVGAAGTGGSVGERVVLAKPRTFMNESGGPVAGLKAFFGVPLDRLIVVHDELDIDFETLRIKDGGGDNGHNGLRSITKSLGTREYLRVRVGIGRPPGRMDPAAFVLRDFSPTERAALPVNLERAADVVESVLDHGLAATQNRFHSDTQNGYQTDGA
ncbi:MAG TPA: aminoacyl-tRNA hydrolase [Acidothermaceae bacterium]